MNCSDSAQVLYALLVSMIYVDLLTGVILAIAGDLFKTDFLPNDVLRTLLKDDDARGD